MHSIGEDVTINGNLTVTGNVTGSLSRSSLARESGAGYPLLFSGWRVWDAFQTVLPGTPATDDLGVIGVTFGGGGFPPYVSTGDLKAAGATTRRARVLFQLPFEYQSGQSLLIRFYAGMLTTVASVSATIDAEAFIPGTDTAYDGADNVTTAALTINSLTFASRDFVIDTGNGIQAGDLLDIRVSIAVNDAATVTAVIGAIAKAEMILTIRG